MGVNPITPTINHSYTKTKEGLSRVNLNKKPDSLWKRIFNYVVSLFQSCFCWKSEKNLYNKGKRPSIKKCISQTSLEVLSKDLTNKTITLEPVKKESPTPTATEKSTQAIESVPPQSETHTPDISNTLSLDPSAKKTKRKRKKRLSDQESLMKRVKSFKMEKKLEENAIELLEMGDTFDSKTSSFNLEPSVFDSLKTALDEFEAPQGST